MCRYVFLGVEDLEGNLSISSAAGEEIATSGGDGGQ